MGADIENGIPSNVVEIGNEITQGVVDALNAAPSPTATNRFAVVNDLNLKANLNGATFTGKINCTVVGGISGLNVGVGGTSGASSVAGDIWIPTGGVNLNFRDGTGAWRILATLNGTNAWTGTNTFTTQAVNDNSTKAATTEFVNKYAPVVTTVTGNLITISGNSVYNSVYICSSSGSANINIDATTSSLPIGAQFVFIQNDTTTKGFTASVGVTLRSFAGKVTMAGQYAVCTLIKTGANEWTLSGNLI